MRRELTTNSYSANCLNSYKEQEIVMSSPEKCILHLYDIAIQGCVREHEERVGRALAQLMDALNFQAGGEIAEGLFRLYEYCLNMVHQKQFENSRKILSDLRETWQAALSKQLAA